MKAEAGRIRDQLRRAHAGEAWHGPSVRETLRGVDAEMARARPVPRAHSIQEIVVHIAAWREEALNRLEGRGRELPPAEDWPEGGDWDALLRRLDEAHDALSKKIASLDDGDLDENVEGRKESLYILLHGIIQHDLYHAGQIAILKRALER